MSLHLFVFRDLVILFWSQSNILQQSFVSIADTENAESTFLVQALAFAIGMSTVKIEEESNKQFGKIVPFGRPLYVAMDYFNDDKTQKQLRLGYVCHISFASQSDWTLSDFIQKGKLMFETDTTEEEAMDLFFCMEVHVITLAPHQVHEGGGVVQTLFDYEQYKCKILTHGPDVIIFSYFKCEFWAT